MAPARRFRLLSAATLAASCSAVLEDSATQLPVYRDRAAPIPARVSDLVSRMTTQEKINQLLSLWTQSNGNNYDYITETYGSTSVGAAYGFWLGNAHDNRSRWEAQNDLQTYMVTHSRLGIPIDIIEETLHGGSKCIGARQKPLQVMCFVLRCSGPRHDLPHALWHGLDVECEPRPCHRQGYRD